MPRTSHVLALAATLATLVPAARCGADRIALPDSTTIETFRLANGLRVVTRHVPLSGAIAITLAFDQGYRHDPKGREGLTRLLARLRFYGATEAAPARTVEEMPKLRPAGWEWNVGARATRFSESATLGQFPGVIHQMAARLKGVQFGERELQEAIAEERAELAADYRDSLDRALYFRLGAVAEGADDEAIARRVAGADLQGLGVREAKTALARLGPGQAVLSLAGDMNAYPIRMLIEKEFGGIPAAAPAPAPRRRPLGEGQRVTVLPGLTYPYGSIGIIAPALDDSLHPGFYAAAIQLGVFCLNVWGRPDEVPYTRFKVLLFDDPDLAVYYPPLQIDEQLDLQMPGALSLAAHQTFEQRPPEVVRAGLPRGVLWLLGAAMPPEILKQVRDGGAPLMTLASSAAARALWGDEPFWARYRERFQRALEGDRSAWAKYFEDPALRVQVLLIPSTLR